MDKETSDLMCAGWGNDGGVQDKERIIEAVSEGKVPVAFATLSVLLDIRDVLVDLSGDEGSIEGVNRTLRDGLKNLVNIIAEHP